jgi:2-haloacid dehalogenase
MRLRVVNGMEAYLRLAPFPEVKQTLSAFSGMPMGILSNERPRMLEQAIKNAKLDGIFSLVIRVDDVKTYKPSAAAYGLAIRKTDAEGVNIGFVSPNLN